VTGRPTVFTPAIAEEICERLSEGESLRSICRDERMPSERTVRGWVIEDRDGFSTQYARAREAQAHSMAEELLEISDDGSNDWMERRKQDGSVETVLDAEHVQRSRLRADTRKWLLSKMLPKVYGERVTTEHTGPNGGPQVSVTIATDDPVEAAREYQRIIQGR